MIADRRRGRPGGGVRPRTGAARWGSSPPRSSGSTPSKNAAQDKAADAGGLTPEEMRVGRPEACTFRPPRCLPWSGNHWRGVHRMRSKSTGTVTGEQFAQVNNPDPFAPPVWRSPVYRTPEWVIWIVQLARLAWRVVWFVICHPLLDAAAGLIVLDWLNLGWPGLAGLAALDRRGARSRLRLARPGWFTRFVIQPARDGWRRLYYRRRWHAVMTISGLAPVYRGRVAASGAGRGPGGRPGGPGNRPAGVRAVPGRLRQPGRGHRARLRGPSVPGPRRPRRA